MWSKTHGAVSRAVRFRTLVEEKECGRAEEGMRLSVTIITGGSSGIGRAIVQS